MYSLYCRILQLRNTVFKMFGKLWLFWLQLRGRCVINDTSFNAVSMMDWPQLSTQTPFSHSHSFPSGLRERSVRIKVRKNSWVEKNTVVSKGEWWGDEEKKISRAKNYPKPTSKQDPDSPQAGVIPSPFYCWVMGHWEHPFGQLGSALLTDQISLTLTVNLLPTSTSSLGQLSEKQGWPWH